MRADRWYCQGCGAIAATWPGDRKGNKCDSCGRWMKKCKGPGGIGAFIARVLIWLLVRVNRHITSERRIILQGEILQKVHTEGWRDRRKIGRKKGTADE